jgi:hypothetical protein
MATPHAQEITGQRLLRTATKITNADSWTARSRDLNDNNDKENWHELTTKQVHDKMWDVFFPQNEWLSVASSIGLIPVLVGHGLKNFHRDHPTYIVLSTGDSKRNSFCSV